MRRLPIILFVAALLVSVLFNGGCALFQGSTNIEPATSKVDRVVERSEGGLKSTSTIKIRYYPPGVKPPPRPEPVKPEPEPEAEPEKGCSLFGGKCS